MADSTTTLATLREAVRQFVAERQWEGFHSPKNVVMALAVEAAELMEPFLWLDLEASCRLVNDAAQRLAVADEMADVAGCLLNLSNILGIDLSDAIEDKMRRNAAKYPAAAPESSG